jgi:hypothetical protein
MPQVRVTPSGSLDKDTEISYIRQGNYTDANDVRHRDSDGQNFGGVMCIGGNNLEVTIPDYTSTTQEYRVYIDVESLFSGEVNSHDINLKLSTGSLATTYQSYNYVSTTTSSAYTAITGHLTSLQSVYNALPGVISSINFTYGSLVTTGTHTAYFTLTATGVNEFSLFYEYIEGEYARFQKISEYQPENGSFTVVGFKQIEDDLFVFLAGNDLNTDGTSKVSEIGNIYPSGSGYAYVTLLTSKNMTFHPERNIEVEAEVIDDKINFYWTDDFNVIRYAYIPVDAKRATNGFLYPNTEYTYDNLSDKTSLILFGTTSKISNVEVHHGGGNISSGNKRYTGRFVTDDFQYSDYLYPTGIVNIYDADPAKPYLVSGNADGTSTTKVVEMQVDNIPVGLYSYFDLIAIEYGSTGFSAKFVERFSIQDNQTQLDVIHSNVGQRMEDMSGVELYAISSKYTKAKSLTVNDQRLVISNLEQYDGPDLSDWASDITHSLEIRNIQGIGYSENILNSELDLKYGEYIDPNNTLEFTSYMMNDTYRFGIQVQWKKTGGWSRSFWVDDIRFDTNISNIIGTRRTANNIDSNLSSYLADDVRSYYVKFGNIDLDTIISGTRIGDLISAFRFVRAKRIPEVLATGVFLPGCLLSSVPNRVMPYFPEIVWNSTGFARASFPNYHRPDTWSNITGGSTLAGTTTGDSIANTDASDYLYFYSPDIKYGTFEYSFDSSKDSLKILGVPAVQSQYGGQVGASSYSSNYLEVDGYFSSSKVAYIDESISDHSRIELGESVSLASKNMFNGANDGTAGISTTDAANIYNVATEGFKVNRKINGNYSASPRVNSEDLGIYYGQIFRNKGGHKKYPVNKSDTVYESTGHIRIIEQGEVGDLTEDVFGGDVYNQKTVYQMRHTVYSSTPNGFGAGLSFYSQNVSNTQMFEVLDHDLTHNGAGYIYPQFLDKDHIGSYATSAAFTTGSHPIVQIPANTMGAGLFFFLQQWPETSNQNEYSSSYNYSDGTLLEKGYDSESDVISNMPTRIAYSGRKTLGSNKNNYRLFQPANVFDLDLTNGEITSHVIVNDNLYTIQPESVQRQYFRDGSFLNTSGGSDIVVGAGGVLSVPGVELTPIGTNLKTSIIKGKNQSGKDILYWYNPRLQKLMRLAGNGIDVLSDRGLSSYFRNNGKYNKNTLYPLSGLGVHGVWNDKYAELIYTFKYNDGTDNQAFTIAYDEAKNGFVSFHSYTPDIYIPYDNTFFTPNPSVPDTIYLHDKGTDRTFYGSLQGSNITFIMNYDSSMIKQFEAMQINSDQLPFETDFYTEDHESYLDETEFIDREGLWYSPIKNDILSAPLSTNAEDTTRLFGKWLKIKFSMETASGTQKLVNGIVKFRISPRLYTQ